MADACKFSTIETLEKKAIKKPDDKFLKSSIIVAKRNRAEAEEWFYSEDFYVVCKFLNLPHTIIQKKLANRLERARKRGNRIKYFR
jgi:hypothetical protein